MKRLLAPQRHSINRYQCLKSFIFYKSEAKDGYKTYKNKFMYLMVDVYEQDFFLDDIFFFLLDNNMDSVLRKEYKI